MRISKLKKKRESLIRDYIVVIIMVGIILLTLFLITNYMLWTSTLKKARHTSGVIFNQAEEQIALYEQSICDLYTNLTYNSSLISYLQADNLADRQDYLTDFYGIVGSTRSINKNIVNMALYNKNSDLIASKGDFFIPKTVSFEQNKMIDFSERIIKGDRCYFQVGMMVYVKDEVSYTNLGSINLLFDTQNLQNIISNALISQEAGIALLDGQDNVIVQAGKWDNAYIESQDTNTLVFNKQLDASQWKIVNIIPEEALVSELDQLQRNNYITFFGVMLIIFFLCLTIFNKVIQPVYKQTKFIESFKENTKQRIKVTEYNEIGKMALALNKMLDDIEVLNKQVIETQCRYLEMDYQKKQMEIIACKNQLNPHFLYNTFDCIRGIALYHDEYEIAQLIQALSSLFRYNVKGDEWVTIQEEINHLKEYSTIIDYRFMGKYKIVIQADEEILNGKVPKMLLQPLVENAILHGMEELSGGVVSISMNSDKLGNYVFTVDDNGKGIRSENLEAMCKQMEDYDSDLTVSMQEQGIGLLNVYRRVRLLYNKKADLFITSEIGMGTKVRIILPQQV